jgi:hypothetical protein
MSLANCRQCGKIHLNDRTPFCPECKLEQDEIYRVVRENLKQNPNSTLLEVHTATGISIAKLLEMKKRDYLPFG